MYQVLVGRGYDTLDVIAFARNWCRPFWRVFVALWVAVLVTLLVLYISPNTAPPTTRVGGLDLDLDKVFHILAHGGTIALPLALIPQRRLAYTMMGVAIFCGFGFEFCQLFVPERSFDLHDIMANLTGLIIGARSGRFVRELDPRLA